MISSSKDGLTLFGFKPIPWYIIAIIAVALITTIVVISKRKY